MARTPIHPGEHLADDLQALGMSASAFAAKIDVPVNRITAILNGTRAITADTASPAVRSEVKSASNVRTACGTGSSRTAMRVATPKFPSEPVNRPTRSGPHGSPPGLPSCTTCPSPSTTSSASTLLTVEAERRAAVRERGKRNGRGGAHPHIEPAT